MDTNIRDDAYNQIKYNIIHFHYLPQQKVSEKMISTSLKLGRTPVREAIIRIEREGLIEVIPQSGTYITTIDMHLAKESRFVRESIEENVMQQAVVRVNDKNIQLLNRNMKKQELAAQSKATDDFFDLDQDFHHTFYKIAGHDSFWQWLQLNTIQLDRFRRLRLKVPGLDWQTLLRHHQNILNAFINKDIDELKYLTHIHTHLMLDEQQKVVERYPNYFTNIDI